MRLAQRGARVSETLMTALVLLTGVACLVSFSVDRRKTAQGLQKAIRKFGEIIVPFAWVVLMVSVALYLVSDETLAALLTGSTPLATTVTGLLAGAVIMLPGAIAFPLGAVFLDKGVPPSAVAGFTSSLMMVGIVTLGIERRYLGLKVALARNVAGLVIAAMVATVTAMVLGG